MTDNNKAEFTERPSDRNAAAPKQKNGNEIVAKGWQKLLNGWQTLEFDRKIELWLAAAITIATIANVCIAARQWNAAATNNQIARTL